jgi:hypothetical protein
MRTYKVRESADNSVRTVEQLENAEPRCPLRAVRDARLGAVTESE